MSKNYRIIIYNWKEKFVFYKQSYGFMDAYLLEPGKSFNVKKIVCFFSQEKSSH